MLARTRARACTRTCIHTLSRAEAEAEAASAAAAQAQAAAAACTRAACAASAAAAQAEAHGSPYGSRHSSRYSSRHSSPEGDGAATHAQAATVNADADANAARAVRAAHNGHGHGHGHHHHHHHHASNGRRPSHPPSPSLADSSRAARTLQRWSRRRAAYEREEQQLYALEARLVARRAGRQLLAAWLFWRRVGRTWRRTPSGMENAQLRANKGGRTSLDEQMLLYDWPA